MDRSHTGERFAAAPVTESVTTAEGLAKALDCDLLFSCVDRPWPRHVLNAVAYGHLVPVLDGGILARVTEAGKLLEVNWRIHTVGPGRACMYCLDALRRSDVALDREGKLDDPDYVNGLSLADRERYGRRNVFAFSLSVAAHLVLQAVGLIAGSERIGGTGPQAYSGYPGVLELGDIHACAEDCEVAAVVASGCDVLGT